ncbi:MAG TPA: TadE family protein [Candidatus Limnocylindria bacterium]
MIPLLGKRLRRSERGQSLVELAMVIPFLMFLILGAIEFGFIFTNNLTMEYATREGARVGASLANGGGPLGCGPGGSPNAATVDGRIVAAVERVLEGSGSPVRPAQVQEIRIFKANATGGEVAGQVNVWRYAPSGGPLVDGQRLDFAVQSTGWQTCSRTNNQPADSVGVGLRYRYALQTPFLSLSGMSTLTMYDHTVMALNPTGQ